MLQRCKNQQQQHMNGGVVKYKSIATDVDYIVDVEDGGGVFYVFGNGNDADGDDVDDEGQR